jgi:hypothetical protein
MARGKPFKPGEDPRRNTKGAPPKDETIGSYLRDLLGQEDISLPDGTKISRRQAIAIKAVNVALAGSVPAMRLVFEAEEGIKPVKVQPVDEDGKPMAGAVFHIKKETLDSWRKKMKDRVDSYGNPKNDKPKPWRVPRSSSSSEEPKAAAKATSSSATGSKTTTSGAKRGAVSSSAAPIKSLKKSSAAPKKSTRGSKAQST